MGLLLTGVTVLPSCQGFYTQMASREADGLAALHATLAGVNDTQSADRAAASVDEYGSVLMEDIKGLFSHGRPNLLELYLLKNDYRQSNLKPVARETLTEVFRLYRNNFYGSQALRLAFTRQLSRLR